jgi:hypothetical protein
MGLKDFFECTHTQNVSKNTARSIVIIQGLKKPAFIKKTKTARWEIAGFRQNEFLKQAF